MPWGGLSFEPALLWMSFRVGLFVAVAAAVLLLLAAGVRRLPLSAALAPPPPLLLLEQALFAPPGAPPSPLPAEDVFSTSSRAAELRLLFCKNSSPPWEFDYVPLAWRRATQLLNQTASEPAEVRELDEQQRATLRRFYGYDSGAALFYAAASTTQPTCAYLRQFRAGSTRLVKNMEAWTRRRSHIIPAVELAVRFPSLPAFTWTRHPMDRLISGYAEIVYRATPGSSAYGGGAALHNEHVSSARIAGGVSYLSQPPGSEQRFLLFLSNLLSGAPIFEVEHVYAACGVIALAGQRPLSVQRLEKAGFDTSVRAFCAQCGGGIQAYNDSLGHVYGTSLENEPTASADLRAAREVLMRGGRVTDAVCLLLLPDFACLDYAMPDRCKGVMGRFRAELALLRAVGR